MADFDIKIPTPDKIVNVSLNKGEILFVVGANGTGKSALMHRINVENGGNSIRIISQRRNATGHQSIDMTMEQANSYYMSFHGNDLMPNSRYDDVRGTIPNVLALRKIFYSEQEKQIEIGKAYQLNKIGLADEINNKKTSWEVVNEILFANLGFLLDINSGLFPLARREDDVKYPVDKLSDGERNALFLLAEVITAASGTLIIIDEPERHLHRSIISPLLSALLIERPDCAFIISTHNIDFILDNRKSKTLFVRGCSWGDDLAKSWDFDYLEENSTLPDGLFEAILGSRRRILFTEGAESSLDKRIYPILFPELTVVPSGNCEAVIRNVKGISNSDNLHWLEPFGLIDADDRTSDQILELQQSNIAALNCYSVEYLFYHPEILRLVDVQQSEIFDLAEGVLLQAAKEKIIPVFRSQRDRFCARICERKIKNKILQTVPSYDQLGANEHYNLSFSIADILNEEKEIYDLMCDESDYTGLMSRYPIRESQLLTNIAHALRFRNTNDYEGAVVSLLVRKQEARETLLGVLANLSELCG